MISKFHSRLFSYVEISRFSVMIWTRAAATVMLFTLLISEVAGQNTSFIFNSTTGINDLQGAPMFLVSGDAIRDAHGKLLALNNDIANQESNVDKTNCGRVVYKDKVRLRDKTNGDLASFHTSFTFSFASKRKNQSDNLCGQGMLFMFSPNSNVGDLELSLSGRFLCALNWNQTDLRLFAVEIDSKQNPRMSDVSDSHIGLDVGRATLVEHNLCLPADTNQNCAFFCNDPNATYTTWIDYDSRNQTLQVWFRNGSGVAKPSDPVISYPNLRLDTMLDDEMYVGFIGSTGASREVHTIWAWEFATTGFSSAPTSKSGSKTLIGEILGGALAALLVAGIIVYFGWIRRKMSKPQAFYELPHSFQDESRSYTFKELSEMTKGFSASEKLSSGGYGDVYKGTLPSGELVAVKRIKEDEKQAGEVSFLAEVRSLRQTRHRNLLQLRGWSYSADGMFLVYEFMCNGSLNKWLHPHGELNWDVRRAILAGVASGLEYLHEDGMKCVLHRDIKSDNVLLDADFNPYLGDFGLARVVDHHRKEKTTRVAGTDGYMAPEMPHTSKATKETDVYAFGVLALEVVTGRKPTRMQDGGGLENLVDSVWRAHESGSLESMVDPRLGDPRNNQTGNLAGDQGIHDEEELELEDLGMFPERVLKVGLMCCLPNPSHRPSMRLVNQWFQSSSERMVLPELPEVQPRFGRSPMPLVLENSEASTSFNDVSSSLSSNPSGSAKG